MEEIIVNIHIYTYTHKFTHLCRERKWGRAVKEKEKGK